MTRFEIAEKKLLNKQYCMRCGVLNSPNAKRCRKCHRSDALRRKAKEARGV